jgi:hypothetical protein
MELTKEQILHIDHRLENDGVKYWDIRIEMLDHVVSDVEKHLQLESSENEFKEMVQESFIALGWKVNFNGNNFPNSNTNAWKNVNKEYRRMYHQGFINFFKSFKNIGLLLCFIVTFLTVSNYVNFKIFKTISFVLFVLPILFFIFYSIKVWLKKFGKSIHLNYGNFYFGLAFIMFNMPLQFIKYTTESNQRIFLIISISIYFIATYSGYQVYKKAVFKVEKMRKELLS